MIQCKRTFNVVKYVFKPMSLADESINRENSVLLHLHNCSVFKSQEKGIWHNNKFEGYLQNDEALSDQRTDWPCHRCERTPAQQVTLCLFQSFSAAQSQETPGRDFKFTFDLIHPPPAPCQQARRLDQQLSLQLVDPQWILNDLNHLNNPSFVSFELKSTFRATCRILCLEDCRTRSIEPTEIYI